MTGAPLWITLEGGEGAGKSTQLRLLAQSFERSGLLAICTREPGGCPSAEQIRGLLVSGEADRWLAETEALLMMAARFEHVHRTILPALEAQKTVLCDRFFDSTLVYQGIGKGLGEDWLWMQYRHLFGQCLPDVTLYLDLPPEEGLARTQSRNGSEARFESLPLSFHEAVRGGFLQLAKRFPERIITIGAQSDLVTVHHAIIGALNDRFALGLAKAEAQNV